VVLARAPAGTLDCGALLKQLAAAHGGKGGGRPERAEGRLAAGVDWPAALAALLP
jgi:alanyl-tRNA synthetase